MSDVRFDLMAGSVYDRMERIAARLGDLTSEIRRYPSKPKIEITTPFACTIEIFPDGEEIQVDVNAFVKGFNTQDYSEEAIVDGVQRLVFLLERWVVDLEGEDLACGIGWKECGEGGG